MNLETWRQQVAQKLQTFTQWVQQRRQQDLPYVAYGTLAGLTLWPIVQEAVATGQVAPVILTLYQVAAGVGANLVATQIENWKNQATPPTEAEVVQWVAQQAPQNAELVQTLDTLLQKLDAFPGAHAALPDAEKAWFARALTQELTQLGNLTQLQMTLTNAGIHIADADAVVIQDSHINAPVLGQGASLTIVQSEKEAPKRDNRSPDELRADYLNWVLPRAGELSLLGIDPKAAADEQEGQIHLHRVYTALLTAATEERQGIGKAQEGLRLREPKPISAVAQLDRQQRLVLLGDPGSGKSTFIKFVAFCHANEMLQEKERGLRLLTAPLPDDDGSDSDKRQPWAHGALLPLPVILRDFAARGLPAAGKSATVNHLWQFIAQELESADLTLCLPLLKAQFKAGRAILLLDGLDEVPEADQRRDQIKQVVEAFARTYRHSHVLITSRTYAYRQQQWQLQDFAATELLPFTPGQIRRFVDGWYRYTAERRGMDPGLAQQRADQLKAVVLARPRLRELAERPLLLTLMASLHAWRMGDLPRQRQKLYEETVDLLLDRWESRLRVWDGQQERELHSSLAEWLKTDREKVRDLLNRLAFEAHRDQPDLAGTADVPQEKLLKGLLDLSDNPNARPRQLEVHLRDRAGLIAERGKGVYTFPHRTFQEYLAACYFENQDPEYPFSLAALAREKPNKWREVVLLAGAKAGRNHVWSLADALCPAAPPALAAEAEPPAATDAAVEWEANLWGAHLAAQMLLEIIEPDAALNALNRQRMARIKGWLVHCLTTGLLSPTERALAGQSLGLLGDPRPRVACTVPWMVDIPAGPFLMGSDKKKDKQALDREEPQHTVTLPAYRIGQYPVTNAQFRAFVEAGGYDNADYWTESGWRQKQRKKWTEPRYVEDPRYNVANQPVVGVSWYEAVAYCRWLKATTGRHFRLPDEAMWEKAARGTDGRIYPWGDAWDATRLNAAETGINRPTAVGIFPTGKSPYEVYDACGNVSEWCSSVTYRKVPYPFKIKAYEEEIEGDAARSRRGGAFDYYRQDARAAYRSLFNADYMVDLLGFRVAEHLSDPVS